MLKISLFTSMIGILLQLYAIDCIDVKDTPQVTQSPFMICNKGLQNRRIPFTLVQDFFKYVTAEHNHCVTKRKNDLNTKEQTFLENESTNHIQKEASDMAKAFPFFKKGSLPESLSNLLRKRSLCNDGILGNECMDQIHIEKNSLEKEILLLSTYPPIMFSMKNQKNIGGCHRQLILEQKKMKFAKRNAQINLLEKPYQAHEMRLKSQDVHQERLVASNVMLLAALCMVILFYTIALSKKKSIRAENMELNNLNTLKDELLSVLAHDLRSHTHHLIEVTDQMKMKLQESDAGKLRELIRVGNSAANKTYVLLDNVLHWIMLNDKNVFFQKENIDLSSLLEQVTPIFSSILEMKQIQFEIEVLEQAYIYGDVNSLKVVLRNLIDNAIKFTPNHGEIKINVTQCRRYANLSIIDTGMGMDDSILQRVRNSMIENETDTIGKKSTGLGLRLCFSFVKRNGGAIKIESKRNVGTGVFVKLPKS